MFRRLVNGLMDIIYPRRCLACKNKIAFGAIDNLVCDPCWAKVEKNTPPFCHGCGRRLDKKSIRKNICPSCQKSWPSFDRAFSPCVYTGVVKELIHEFKYRGKDHLGLPLSRLMIDFIREYNLPMQYIDLVVPVPLHAAKLRQREFNQAEVLALHIAREFKKEPMIDLLRRTRHTRTQTELEPRERILNVKNSFSVEKKSAVKGANILLIDDVLTTGATSSEASGVLKKEGANIVFVLTLAN
ncbi:MAG: ComF family protein [Candidatus Omnitrophica bacterium]|nr:ComF family protein [Candidatus Omnitrophota bacterium]